MIQRDTFHIPAPASTVRAHIAEDDFPDEAYLDEIITGECCFCAGPIHEHDDVAVIQNLREKRTELSHRSCAEEYFNE